MEPYWGATDGARGGYFACLTGNVSDDIRQSPRVTGSAAPPPYQPHADATYRSSFLSAVSRHFHSGADNMGWTSRGTTLVNPFAAGVAMPEI